MIKTFENFVNDGPAVVLNLKERNGKILNFHPVYAVETSNYRPGYPPMISSIPREERTEEQKKFLSLAGYLDDKFKILRKLPSASNRIFSDIDPYGEENWGEDSSAIPGENIDSVIEYMEEKGHIFRKTLWGTRVTEMTISFKSKEEIDNFLNDFKSYLKLE